MNLLNLFGPLLLSIQVWSNDFVLPPSVRLDVNRRIHRELENRATRLNCRVSNSEIVLSKVRTNTRGERELEYQVQFQEHSSQSTSSRQVLKKKLTFSKDWQLLKITPLQQEIVFETGSEVFL